MLMHDSSDIANIKTTFFFITLAKVQPLCAILKKKVGETGKMGDECIEIQKIVVYLQSKTYLRIY
jgi:hypothetical protein